MGDDSPAQGACPNCGEPRPGEYCPSCGQRQGDRIHSVRHLLRDALDDQLSLNSALPRTLRALFTRPGFLTAEYFAGRIVRYIAPFRLYLASSILFFLVLGLVQRVRGPAGVVEIEATADSAAAGPPRPTVVRIEEGTFLGIRIDEDLTADTTVIWVNFGPRWASEIAAARVTELSQLPPAEIAGAIVPSVLERVPAGMFVLLPAFAAMLKLILWRKRRYYVEHFVFALHTHAFTFLTLSVVVTIDVGAVTALGAFGILAYYAIAMRRFYGLNWPGTLVRGFVLLVAYDIMLITLLLVALALAVMLG